MNTWKSLFFCTILLNNIALAETLVSPTIPGKGEWDKVVEQPLQDQNKKTIGKMAMYSQETDSQNFPQNILLVYEMDRLPSTSPVDHANNHALALQQQCESSQITRPTQNLERGVPVTYIRAFCTKVRGGNGGFVQSIKILQGKEQLFMVARQWTAPAFSFDPTAQNRMQFAKSIFKTESAAGEWIAQADATQKHLEVSVTLCSTKQSEFGESCPSKK